MHVFMYMYMYMYIHVVFICMMYFVMYIHCTVQGVGVGKAEVFVNGHLAATTDEQGMYTLSHITSGSYRLMVCGLQGMRHVHCVVHTCTCTCTFIFTCYPSVGVLLQGMRRMCT